MWKTPSLRDICRHIPLVRRVLRITAERGQFLAYNDLVYGDHAASALPFDEDYAAVLRVEDIRAVPVDRLQHVDMGKGVP